LYENVEESRLAMGRAVDQVAVMAAVSHREQEVVSHCIIGAITLVFHLAAINVRLRSQLRYDTRCYFNARCSKADMSQLNLPHGTDNKKL